MAPNASDCFHDWPGPVKALAGLTKTAVPGLATSKTTNLTLPLALSELFTAMPRMMVLPATLICVPHESPTPREVELCAPVRLSKICTGAWHTLLTHEPLH